MHLVESGIRSFGGSNRIASFPGLEDYGPDALRYYVMREILGGSLFFFRVAAGRRLHRAGQHDLLLPGRSRSRPSSPPSSNDYNLITVYPLMAVLFVRSLSPGAALSRIALFALLVMITGPRILFLGQEHRYVGLQVLALLVAAAASMRASDAPSRSEHAS